MEPLVPIGESESEYQNEARGTYSECLLSGVLHVGY